MTQEQEIFEQAKALPSCGAREAYLIGACGQNRELRRSVDELLAAFNDAGEIDFLKAGDRSPEGRTVPAGDTLVSIAGKEARLWRAPTWAEIDAAEAKKKTEGQRP
jgi:hypothetical protein